MPKTLSLQTTDRDFLSLIVEAAFANPFSERRETLDAEITGGAACRSRPERIQLVHQTLRARLDAVETASGLAIGKYNKGDQEILKYALLFDAYHLYKDRLDELINNQIKSGDTPCKVPFASELLARLSRQDFTPEEALRSLALFYQMRRAFYFIDQSLVGRSPCMRELRRHLWNNIFTSDLGIYERLLWNRMEDFSTLLLGGTGTGKGAAAAAIGRSGYIPFDEDRGQFQESFTRNFIAINLSQYPESLIESELFGHRKGAFTGAIAHHEGVFARCTPHGTIFLDEIGDVSVPVQIKLLQVLQERTFSPVGAHETLRFTGRVVAATNKSLDRLREQEAFREDFYYRLCSDSISLPSLYKRIQEDPTELKEMIAFLTTRIVGEADRGLIRQVAGQLAQSPGSGYRWPGNVRELEQAIRSVILSGHYRGTAPPTDANLLQATQTGLAEGRFDAQHLLSRYCRLLYDRHGTYEEVARITQLDRRTVKKHILSLEKDPV